MYRIIPDPASLYPGYAGSQTQDRLGLRQNENCWLNSIAMYNLDAIASSFN